MLHNHLLPVNSKTTCTQSEKKNTQWEWKQLLLTMRPNHHGGQKWLHHRAYCAYESPEQHFPAAQASEQITVICNQMVP